MLAVPLVHHGAVWEPLRYTISFSTCPKATSSRYFLEQHKYIGIAPKKKSVCWLLGIMVQANVRHYTKPYVVITTNTYRW